MTEGVVATGDANEPSASNEPALGQGWISATQVAGLASIGAGAVHAAAIGIHAEHPTLSRLFVAVAAAQLVAGVVTLVRGTRFHAALTVIVSSGAVLAWAITRISGISWVDGLEVAESPQFADTVCAALGIVAILGGLVAMMRPVVSPARPRFGVPALAVGALSIAAMLSGATHAHSDHGGEPEAAGAGHAHAAGEAMPPAAGDMPHAHDPVMATGDTMHGHEGGQVPAEMPHAHDAADPTATTEDASTETTVEGLAWPRPYDPTAPIDFSGVPGVTAEQQARAEALVAATQAQLPQFADVSTLPALGYRSIGDSSTGFEHYINYGFIGDEVFLDPNKPESLVYQVDGDTRTLVSAMFIATETPIDDPELVDYGGPLMQWHVHENLCWAMGDDGPEVIGVVDADGNCPPASINAGGGNPMVHVWIAPHECGPFAALEGHGAGQTDPATGARTDQCHHDDHDASGGPTDSATAAAETHPYDPTKPIDLSGVDGVTPEQQAYAENLVAITLIELPQWADPAVAEAAGFHSIGDGGTGHEHFINWDWIEDDVWLDPDQPESLVYEPQPDGSRKLVSAMFMLPTSMTLDDVPNSGGQLMQWHIHDNLCFSTDPEAPQVRGLTNADGTCSPPLVKLAQSPMIHVWITPNECGPFAALEGVGAGRVREGEQRWCDHAHGADG